MKPRKKNNYVPLHTYVIGDIPPIKQTNGAVSFEVVIDKNACWE